jgi:hypothetical protein
MDGKRASGREDTFKVEEGSNIQMVANIQKSQLEKGNWFSSIRMGKIKIGKKGSTRRAREGKLTDKCHLTLWPVLGSLTQAEKVCFMRPSNLGGRSFGKAKMPNKSPDPVGVFDEKYVFMLIERESKQRLESRSRAPNEKEERRRRKPRDEKRSALSEED